MNIDIDGGQFSYFNVLEMRKFSTVWFLCSAGWGGTVGGAEWPISQQTDPKLTSGDKIVNSPRIKITAAALTQPQQR